MSPHRCCLHLHMLGSDVGVCLGVWTSGAPGKKSLGTGTGAGLLVKGTGVRVLGAGVGNVISMLRTGMEMHFLGASIGACMGTNAGA